MMNFGSQTEIRERSVETAKVALDFCRKLDSTLYSCHTGFLADIDFEGNLLSGILPKEKALRNITKSLRDVCDVAEQHGIRVAIENQAGTKQYCPSMSATDYRQLLKDVDSPMLGLLMDLGHLAIDSAANSFDPRQRILDLSDHILEFHVHETFSGKDHQPLNDPGILSRFGISRQLAARAFVTLEANGLSVSEISSSLDVLEEALRDL
jgi:sugar phosphate isomerase/epimerase